MGWAMARMGHLRALMHDARLAAADGAAMWRRGARTALRQGIGAHELACHRPGHAPIRPLCDVIVTLSYS